MKPIPLSKYRPPLGRLASMQWGGDCSSAKTTRKGIGYYSCAGHGGYMVDGRVLTEKEKQMLEKLAPKSKVNVLVQHQPQGDMVIDEDTGWFSTSGRRKRFSYNPAYGEVEWVEIPIFEGEEDEMWCVIETITGVRHNDYPDPKKHEEYREECFERTTRRRE
jgi:hypothetical protein